MKYILKQNNISFHNNDSLRLDRHTSYNCLSIGFPNDVLFSRFRAISQSKKSDWAIFLIKPDILWNTSANFSITNIAKACGKFIGKQPEYFASFFQDNDCLKTRSLTNLDSYMPTDVQSEILIPQVIPTEYLRFCLVFEEKVTTTLPSRENFYLTRPLFFGTRSNYIQNRQVKA